MRSIPLWRNVALAAALAPVIASLPYVVTSVPSGLFLIPMFYMVAGIPALVGAVPFVCWLRRQQRTRVLASAGVGALAGAIASVLFGIGVDVRDLLLNRAPDSQLQIWNVKTWLFLALHGVAAGVVGGAFMSRFHFKGNTAP